MALMFMGLYLVLWAKGKEGFSQIESFDCEFDAKKPLLSWQNFFFFFFFPSDQSVYKNCQILNILRVVGSIFVVKILHSPVSYFYAAVHKRYKKRK